MQRAKGGCSCARWAGTLYAKGAAPAARVDASVGSWKSLCKDVNGSLRIVTQYLCNAKGGKLRIGDPLGVLGRGVVTRVSATVNSLAGCSPCRAAPERHRIVDGVPKRAPNRSKIGFICYFEGNCGCLETGGLTTTHRLMANRS